MSNVSTLKRESDFIQAVRSYWEDPSTISIIDQNLHELEIEKVVRESVSRGTVSVTVRVRPLGDQQLYVLDRDVLENYWRQLNQLAD